MGSDLNGAYLTPKEDATVSAIPDQEKSSVLTAKCFTLSTPHAILRGCRELRRLFPWPLSKPINSVVRCGQAARRPRR